MRVLSSQRPLRILTTLTACLLLVSMAPEAESRARGNPRGRVLRPKPQRTDAELHAKALELQAKMAAHLSPEGVLVDKHRIGATPEQLSHDALALADVPIWTGCYLGSQAARWHVTRDPEALDQVRRLLGGLWRLSNSTGTPGRLVRTVGRPVEGEVLETRKLTPCPNGSGMWMRTDISRDQLAGVAFGYACVAKWVDDPELRELARAGMVGVAQRLYDDKMWLRDHRGKKTEHGELRVDVEGLPFMKNGPLACIGYAPFSVAAHLDGSREPQRWKEKLDEAGWRRALDNQQTTFTHLMTNSNVNMACLALTAIRLTSGSSAARRGLESLRAASRGWWNGGIQAMYLIGGGRNRRAAADELRVSLHAMDTSEIPPAQEVERKLRRITSIKERGVSNWHWKRNVNRLRYAAPGSPPHPTLTYTRADWLFAYWLGRAAGVL